MISGIGMVTSVGHTFHESCAAIRAGLSRPARIAGEHVFDEDEQNMDSLVGHPIQGITEGFFGAGLWVRLGRLCLAELAERCLIEPPSNDVFWARSEMFAVTPDPDADRFEGDGSLGPQFARDVLLETLAVQLGLPLAQTQMLAFAARSAGLFQALAIARARISTGHIDRVIVLCIDSLLDDMTIEWLANHGRLKGPDQPSGLAPGEAAVALVIESRIAAVQRDLADLVGLESIGFQPADDSHDMEHARRGWPLVTAMQAALANSRANGFDGDCVGDLNGEAWKAGELAAARMRLGAELGRTISWHLPCNSIGDTGCAMSGVSIAYGAWRLVRNLSGVGRALVFCIGEHGEAGAAALCMN